MTDKEIINALECCKKVISDCNNCPYYNSDDCENELIVNALDLINRQQAEIGGMAERLYEYPVKTRIDNYNVMCSKTSEDYEDCLFRMEKDMSYQAIREFKKRAKEAFLYGCCGEKNVSVEYVICVIDNIFKEMRGRV